MHVVLRGFASEHGDKVGLRSWNGSRCTLLDANSRQRGLVEVYVQVSKLVEDWSRLAGVGRLLYFAAVLVASRAPEPRSDFELLRCSQLTLAPRCGQLKYGVGPAPNGLLVLT